MLLQIDEHGNVKIRTQYTERNDSVCMVIKPTTNNVLMLRNATNILKAETLLKQIGKKLGVKK
jgi:hypothetical protein